MNTAAKLAILSRAAKYDVSCSSSGSKRSSKKERLGDTAKSGICHSWTEDGRCVSLLKILFSNVCVYDCYYCINGYSNNIERASFTPEEICSLTVEFYRRNYIEGLFLSSAIVKGEDHTMELLAETARKLREEYQFDGYIHLKGIPGADYRLLNRAGQHVDRLSLNVELPSRSSLKELAPDKSPQDIFSSMNYVGNQITKYRHEARKFKNSPSFVPAGQSTQLIAGATYDSDSSIIKLAENLYQKYRMKRVYYSAFIPVANKYQAKLPDIASPPYLREHRLYQADWLLRFYKFSHDELFQENSSNLTLDFDPKVSYALANFHLFPVEINKASKTMLLRVPGIGPKSAKRIITARKHYPLKFQDLKSIGVVSKRAKYFITCKGKYYGGVIFDMQNIKDELSTARNYQQLSLWESGA